MQMSPLILFCEYCGAANTMEARDCFACKHPLQSSFSTGPVQSPIPATPMLSFASAPDHLSSGLLLNQRYTIVSEIGQGGFSTVYAARDAQQRNKKVAIKQINLRSLKPRQIIEATDTYNREVRLLSELKHANLPHIYDHFTDADHWYLVMDFIEGETLEDYAKKAANGYLSVKEVLNIGIQLCRVLNVLHRQTPPVIFRDVKPANIMRTPKGRLYLIDFGIARHFSSGQNKDTGPLGTPGYAAPEQYGTAQTTVRSDIYSLGATLQTLLTGCDPLDDASTPGQPVPQKLQQLLDQMLELDPGKRPKSIKEVQLQLETIKRGKIGAVLLLLWGLTIGSLPYLLIWLLLFSGGFLLQQSSLALWFLFYVLLLIFWPFAWSVSVILAIQSLSSPPRRLMGLGMLMAIAFIIIAILLGWLPFPPLYFGSE